MKNNKFYLIMACIFILIIFSGTVTASEDITSNNTNQINLNDNNINIEGITETHIVDGSAYNQMDNPTIQQAINNAQSGDTILITGTSYIHCHFVVDKNLTIISNVETTMSPCPSNIDGSNGIGIFYISPEASGTTISGFVLTNNEFKSGTVNPYCIYINEANNVKIKNCTIEKTYNGPGIFINNAKSTLIENDIIKESEKGIYLENCKDTTIKNNKIDSNYLAGIYVGSDSNNLNIIQNIIHANNYYGIYLGSATNTLISSNKITENRDNPIAQRAENGTGLFVDTPVTNLRILGNLFEDNGKYGIYDSYKFTNMVNQYVQIVNGNYFITHTERAIYHASPQNTTTIVYVWSNYYSNELFCGGTCYEPGVLIGNHERDLIMSEINEIKNGIYSVSFIRKDTKEIATDLNSINITFFLNKNNNYPLPQTEDIYKTIPIVNGTAIADFSNETYLKTGNTITAVGPGIGNIVNQSSGSRPCQIFNVPDNHIPEKDSRIKTNVTGNSLVKYYGNSNPYIITLIDNGTPLANQVIIINLNGKKYEKITDKNGQVSMGIWLKTGVYNVQITYDGNKSYKPSSFNDTIIIKSTIDGKNITKYFANDTQYTAKFVDENGNLLKNKEVIFNINGVLYRKTTNAQGIAQLGIYLNPKNYTITCQNPINNELYSNNITVLPIIINNNLVKYFINDSQYAVKLLDNKGKPAVNKNVTFNINGVLYNKQSDNNGIAQLGIYLAPKNYTITTYYNGLFASNSIRVLPIIESENLKMYANSRVPFTVKLLDGKGKPVSGQNVTFNVNGVLYNKQSDNNGIAQLEIYLNPRTYTITSVYNHCIVSNTIEIIPGGKIATELITNNEENYYNNESYSVILKDYNNNSIKNQNIDFLIANKTYTTMTDAEGIANLKLDFNAGNYNVLIKYAGNDIYNPSLITKNITIIAGTILYNATNQEIQNIIDSAKSNDIIKLTAPIYNNVSLVINKPIVLITNNNSTLNGEENKNVVTLNVDGATLNGFKIIVNNGTGISVKGNDNKINNCMIKNNLDSKLINEYDTGKITKPGNGIELINSTNNQLNKNEISDFYNGIYLENTKNNQINNNTIIKNNYGIEFGKDVANTIIQNNNINKNTGLITMDVVEGPLGYGISMRNSGVNVSVLNNYIDNNYEGIFIDAKNCTGIIIIGNSISNNTIEGITFNENYTFAKDAIQPLVENNTIYNNAKGPSMIVLGEISANPSGIYGQGEFNDSLKLHLGANWYGTNKYTKWGNETGAGTICPRISTTLITFNMSCIEPGKYEIKFYNNGTLASQLPDFTVYFTLNFKTDKEIEEIAYVHKGIATFEFPVANYNKTGNIIEASSGSLFDTSREFLVMYTYNIPNSEIPK